MQILHFKQLAVLQNVQKYENTVYNRSMHRQQLTADVQWLLTQENCTFHLNKQNIKKSTYTNFNAYFNSYWMCIGLPIFYSLFLTLLKWNVPKFVTFTLTIQCTLRMQPFTFRCSLTSAALWRHQIFVRADKRKTVAPTRQKLFLLNAHYSFIERQHISQSHFLWIPVIPDQQE